MAHKRVAEKKRMVSIEKADPQTTINARVFLLGMLFGLAVGFLIWGF